MPQPVPPPHTTPPAAPEPTWREALAIPLGLLGAIMGGTVGGFVYYLLIVRVGLIAPFVVGVFVGIGTRWLAQRGSAALAAIAFLVALVGAVVAKWATLRQPPPLAEYLANFSDAFNGLGWTLALLGAGAAALITGVAPPRR